MPLRMGADRVKSLVTFVDRRVRSEGCYHTHRATEDWARRNAIDWADLLDLLEAHDAFCDCEVALNLPAGGDLELASIAGPDDRGNPWLLPPDFACAESAVFTKVVACRAGLGRNTFSSEGEWLIPAPRGAEARRRVRKSVNFFVGCQTGLPSEVGVVSGCPEISASDFARKVAGSGVDELTQFSFREAVFVLSRIALLKPETTVGTYYADRVNIASKHVELMVHRVFMRR